MLTPVLKIRGSSARRNSAVSDSLSTVGLVSENVASPISPAPSVKVADEALTGAICDLPNFGAPANVTWLYTLLFNTCMRVDGMPCIIRLDMWHSYFVLLSGLACEDEYQGTAFYIMSATRQGPLRQTGSVVWSRVVVVAAQQLGAGDRVCSWSIMGVLHGIVYALSNAFERMISADHDLERGCFLCMTEPGLLTAAAGKRLSKQCSTAVYSQLYRC